MVECILEAISGSGKYIIPPVSCRSVCPFGGSLSTFLTHFYCPIPFISSLVFLKKYAQLFFYICSFFFLFSHLRAHFLFSSMDQVHVSFFILSLCVQCVQLVFFALLINISPFFIQRYVYLQDTCVMTRFIARDVFYNSYLDVNYIANMYSLL